MRAVPISVDPEMIKLAASGGTSSFRMMNDCPEASLFFRRYCFKVKSTNNVHYRVSAVYGFVEPMEAPQVEVTRLDGPPKSDDRLEVLFMLVDADCKDAREAFATGEVPEFSIDVPLIAE
uniref:MSP domain-containing protein n=3 Tax=Meloidogyne TaxID=189290 RepID=A0A915P2G5_9BILA